MEKKYTKTVSQNETSMLKCTYKAKCKMLSFGASETDKSTSPKKKWICVCNILTMPPKQSKGISGKLMA